VRLWEVARLKMNKLRGAVFYFLICVYVCVRKETQNYSSAIDVTWYKYVMVNPRN